MVGKLSLKGKQNFASNHSHISSVLSSSIFLVTVVALLTIATIASLLYVLSVTADPRGVIPNARPPERESSSVQLEKPLSVSPSLQDDPAQISVSSRESRKSSAKNNTSTTVTVNGESINLKENGTVKKKITSSENDNKSTLDIDMRSSSSGANKSTTEVNIQSSSETISESGG